MVEVRGGSTPQRVWEAGGRGQVWAYTLEGAECWGLRSGVGGWG